MFSQDPCNKLVTQGSNCKILAKLRSRKMQEAPTSGPKADGPSGIVVINRNLPQQLSRLANQVLHVPRETRCQPANQTKHFFFLCLPSQRFERYSNDFYLPSCTPLPLYLLFSLPQLLMVSLPNPWQPSSDLPWLCRAPWRSTGKKNKNIESS